MKTVGIKNVKNVKKKQSEVLDYRAVEEVMEGGHQE